MSSRVENFSSYFDFNLFNCFLSLCKLCMFSCSQVFKNNKYNNVFVRGYKFGLMTLEFKKFSDPNEDAYYKDFLDLLDTDPKVGNDLGIIKVAFVRDSSKCSIAKIQSSGYKARHFLGIAPQERENDNEYRKKWADKIINFMNNEIKWKYSNNFKFRGDLTKMINGKLANCLDEVLLDDRIHMFEISNVNDIGLQRN